EVVRSEVAAGLGEIGDELPERAVAELCRKTLRRGRRCRRRECGGENQRASGEVPRPANRQHSRNPRESVEEWSQNLARATPGVRVILRERQRPRDRFPPRQFKSLGWKAIPRSSCGLPQDESRD